MSIKKMAGGMFWVAVILIALPMVARIGGRTWNETKDNSLVKGTTGVVSDWAKTALGNTGSGGGFGGFGSSSSPDDLVKAVRDAEAAVKANRSRISDERRAALRRAEDLASKEKEVGIVVEWHPRITWKNAVAGAANPIAVVTDVYRVDQPGGPITVAQPKLNRGDPPTNLDSILVDGGQYSFQAYVGNTPVSGVFGPWIFVKGRAWQSPSGRTVLREPLELLVAVP